MDTNVLVSAFIRPEASPPAEVLDDILSGKVTLLYDDRILAEYAEVLGRKRFGFGPEDVEQLIRQRLVPHGATGPGRPGVRRCRPCWRCRPVDHRKREALPGGRRDQSR